jgi:hypothetical protein
VCAEASCGFTFLAHKLMELHTEKTYTMIKLTISLTILCAALLLTAPARAAEDDGVTVLTAKVALALEPSTSSNDKLI